MGESERSNKPMREEQIWLAGHCGSSSIRAPLYIPLEAGCTKEMLIALWAKAWAYRKRCQSGTTFCYHSLKPNKKVT